MRRCWNEKSIADHFYGVGNPTNCWNLARSAIADGVQRQAQAQTTQAQESNVGNESGILYEVEQERSANAKIFRRTDGTYTALIADEPLHYLKDGVWEEIDNTLEEQPGEEKNGFRK